MLSAALRRSAELDWGFIATGGFLLACLMLGGGSAVGFLSDVTIQLLAIPLLLASLWGYLGLPGPQRPRRLMALVALIVAVPVLQLVPLPPLIWTVLPGRQLVTESLGLLDGELPWAPISVAPTATWLSLLSLLPPLAVFLAMLLMSFRQRRQLSLMLLAFGGLSVALGLSQVASGPTSSLRFFAYTNPSEAVGFFANRNHFAALLYIVILFAAAWASDTAVRTAQAPAGRRFEPATLLPVLACFMLLVVLVAGEMMARSRAGLFLTILALLGGFALAYSDRRTLLAMTPAKLLLGLGILATMFLVQLALYRMLERFATDPLADARIPFARNTFEAAYAFFPFGSGIGTFIPVYAAFEKPGDVLANTFANHAHNDILEWWLEAGMLGIVVVGLGALWMLRQTVRVWRTTSWGTRGIDLLLARAASLAILLVAVHSLFDYPLRTGALAVLVAFCCALLTTPLTTPLGPTEIEDDAQRLGTARTQSVFAEPIGAATWLAPAVTRAKRQTALPTGERWGNGVAWPEAWRKPSKSAPAPGNHSQRGDGADD
jgi:O-antigen ligase